MHPQHRRWDYGKSSDPDFIILATRCVNCVAGRAERLWQHSQWSKLNEGRRIMNPSIEISIDLTAQELTDPPVIAPFEIEVDDICEFDPFLNPSTAANNDVTPPSLDDDEYIEIELTSDQVDALLSGQPIR